MALKPSLLVNIGNTTTTFGVALERLRSLPTARFLEGSVSPAEFPCEAGVWLAASVAPEANVVLERLAQACDSTVAWLGCDMLTGIDCTAVDMSTVGADRMANLAAAVALLPLPAIVLDCGTAITSEVVDRGPRFLGGAILPGRLMARRALACFTGQLPEVSLDDKPLSALGTTTETAIRAGIDLGVLGTVERLVRSTLAEAGFETCTVVATGGDAGFFVANSPLMQAAPDFFTLRGIAEIAKTMRRDGPS